MYKTETLVDGELKNKTNLISPFLLSDVGTYDAMLNFNVYVSVAIWLKVVALHGSETQSAPSCFVVAMSVT